MSRLCSAQYLSGRTREKRRAGSESGVGSRGGIRGDAGLHDWLKAGFFRACPRCCSIPSQQLLISGSERLGWSRLYIAKFGERAFGLFWSRADDCMHGFCVMCCGGRRQRLRREPAMTPGLVECPSSLHRPDSDLDRGRSSLQVGTTGGWRWTQEVMPSRNGSRVKWERQFGIELGDLRGGIKIIHQQAPLTFHWGIAAAADQRVFRRLVSAMQQPAALRTTAVQMQPGLAAPDSEKHPRAGKGQDSASAARKHNKTQVPTLSPYRLSTDLKTACY